MNSNKKKLQYSLLANALFSLICSFILLLFSPIIADLFNIRSSFPFYIIAILLLSFVAMLLYAVFKKPTQKTFLKIIISLDWIWVLGSLSIILVDLFSISYHGKTIIAIIAVVITFFAWLQTHYFNALYHMSK